MSVPWRLGPLLVLALATACSGAPVVVESVEPSASMLPDLGLPGSFSSPAGDYGWTGVLGSKAGMHSVGGAVFRQTQLVFAVLDDCFAQDKDSEPAALTVAGFDGLYAEPYEDPGVLFVPTGDETTGAYALPIGDRTLCVYLSWDPITTDDDRRELAESRQIVESIRGQPYGENGIRITFTLPAGWDTG